MPQGLRSTLHKFQQVRAAYDLDDHANLTLTVYDCNQPFNDNATIELNIADPTHTIDISATSITAGAGVTLRWIFRSDYGACDPSANCSSLADENCKSLVHAKDIDRRRGMRACTSAW